jgi:hypothetical protein
MVNVVDAFQLQETGFSKKEFMAWAKDNMKLIKEYLEEKYQRVFNKNFDDYKFYTASDFKMIA